FFSNSDLSDKVEDEFTGKDAVAVIDFEPSKIGKVDFKGTTWQAESESPVRNGQVVVIKRKESFKLIVEPKK
ncbi:MAG: NfeD family protein, partial [Bacteroidales bacterium]